MMCVTCCHGEVLLTHVCVFSMMLKTSLKVYGIGVPQGPVLSPFLFCTDILWTTFLLFKEELPKINHLKSIQ